MNYEPLIHALEAMPLQGKTVQSFCLFNSDHLDYAKHVQPFCRFLREHEELNVLVFVADDFYYTEEIFDAVSDNHYVITVPPLPFYNAHLYRYFAGFTSASLCLFMGTDTPVFQHNFELCVKTMQQFNYTFHASFMEQTPVFQLSGRAATQGKTSHDLARYAASYLHSPKWNIDQHMIRDFYLSFRPSSVFFAPHGLYSLPVRAFALEAFSKTPTILIRTRNEYDD